MSDTSATIAVPFFKPSLGEAAINEVVETLRSGWLTTGPRVGRFEQAFAEAVGIHQIRHGDEVRRQREAASISVKNQT